MYSKDMNVLLRFGNLTLDEISIFESFYRNDLISLLEGNKGFNKIKNTNSNPMKPKAQIRRELNELEKNKDPKIQEFCKVAKYFLTDSIANASTLLGIMTGIVAAGGVCLSICISVMVAILSFMLLVLPPAMICKLFIKEASFLHRISGKSDDKNVKKYEIAFNDVKQIADDMVKKESVNVVKEFTDIYSQDMAVLTIMENSSMVKAFELGENESNVLELLNTMNVIERQKQAKLSDGIDPQEMDNIINTQNLHEDEVIDIDDMSFRFYSNLTPSDEEDCTLTECVMIDTMDMNFRNLNKIVRESYLTGSSLINGMIYIVIEACNKDTVQDFLQTYANTARYEFTHEGYSDIPLYEATNFAVNFIEKRCEGDIILLENLYSLKGYMKEVLDSTYDAVREEAVAPSTTDTGFNPDPFDIGSLTPFPVGNRKVNSVFCDILKAETDEEITEALIHFAKVSKGINEAYEVITEGKVAKVARSASDKAERKFSVSAMKDKTDTVKTAVKRTTDPMEKFIEQQWDKVREKDANERRNIILKGNTMSGTIAKITRWIKRSIPIIALGVVGQVVPAAAIISGITFLGYVCTDKYLDRRERTKLLQEIEDEIQLVNEKIDDSRGDDNKQNKYELMRIRNQLKRTQDKIRFGLKYDASKTN